MKKMTRLFGILLATVVALASLAVSAILQGCSTKVNNAKKHGVNKSTQDKTPPPPIICDPSHLPPPTTPPVTNPPEKK